MFRSPTTWALALWKLTYPLKIDGWLNLDFLQTSTVWGKQFPQTGPSPRWFFSSTAAKGFRFRPTVPLEVWLCCLDLLRICHKDWKGLHQNGISKVFFKPLKKKYRASIERKKTHMSLVPQIRGWFTDWSDWTNFQRTSPGATHQTDQVMFQPSPKLHTDWWAEKMWVELNHC